MGPANTEFSYVVELATGNHTIKLEVRRVRRRCVGFAHLGQHARPADRCVPGEYWPAPPGINVIPSTPPELVRDEDAIDHDWGEGSPGAAIPVNRFVARWTRTMSFAPGDYEFAVTADDGVRFYVDGRPGDRQVDRPGSDHVPQDAASGRRPARDHDGVLRERRRRGGPPGLHEVGDPPVETDYHAEFWNTPGVFGAPTIPTGPPDLQRDDATLDFDWGEGSPGAGIAAGPVRRALDEVGRAVGRCLPILRWS